jgi:tRNA nucleotidyltransferase (CCA-adding enzyme)
MPKSRRTETDLAAAVQHAIAKLDLLREAAEGAAIYLVGGAVRDLLLGRRRTDLDVVVEGDAAAVAQRLGGDAVEHQRFSTAKATLGGVELDLASARSELYPAPGALPEVRPAGLLEDLARRDFTVNAMALPLQGPFELIDPHAGHPDLEAGLLRVLHDRSFADDPTRALRAARYAARFGFAVEDRTASLLRAADLGTVSEDRQTAELLRLASEPNAVRGLELVAEWGLLPTRDGAAELVPAVEEVFRQPPWNDVAERPRALLRAALGPAGREAELAAARPSRPSEAVSLARSARPEELALARAMGAAWLDDYVRNWRDVKLEIDGSDLIAAGVAEGPALGRGLQEALRRKLDGEVSGREEELRVALEEATGQTAEGRSRDANGDGVA